MTENNDNDTRGKLALGFFALVLLCFVLFVLWPLGGTP